MHYRKMNCPIGELLLVGTEDMLELIGFPEGKGVVQIQSDWHEDGTAFADGAELPPCFGSWFFGLGLTPGRWEPEVIGANYVVPEHIAALQPIRGKLNIFSGLQIFLDG